VPVKGSLIPRSMGGLPVLLYVIGACALPLAIVGYVAIREGRMPAVVWVVTGVTVAVIAAVVLGVFFVVGRSRDETEVRTRALLERWGEPRGLTYVFQPRVVPPAPFLGGCPRSLRGLVGTIAGCEGASLVHHDPLATYSWGVVAQNFDISRGQAAVLDTAAAALGRPADFAGQEPRTVLRLPLGIEPDQVSLPHLDGLDAGYDEGVVGIAADGFLVDAPSLDRMVREAEAIVGGVRAGS
jgi:hypothetical protein